MGPTYRFTPLLPCEVIHQSFELIPTTLIINWDVSERSLIQGSFNLHIVSLPVYFLAKSLVPVMSFYCF